MMAFKKGAGKITVKQSNQRNHPKPITRRQCEESDRRIFEEWTSQSSKIWKSQMYEEVELNSLLLSY